MGDGPAARESGDDARARALGRSGSPGGGGVKGATIRDHARERARRPKGRRGAITIRFDTSISFRNAARAASRRRAPPRESGDRRAAAVKRRRAKMLNRGDVT